MASGLSWLGRARSFVTLFRDFSSPLAVAVAACVLLASGAAHAQQQRALGLDISAWQGNISQTTWNNIHNVENRQFIILRSSRGGTTGYYNQNNAG